MTRPLVYIASPYSKGDPAINTHFQCQVFDLMLNWGTVWPVAPLWSHFQHTLFPRKYEDWIEYDLAILEKCDACLRLNSTFAFGYLITESSGADNEVAAFKRMNKPIFYNLADCYEWASHDPSR